MTVEISKKVGYAVIQSVPDNEIGVIKTDAYVAQVTLPDDELVVTKQTVYVVLKPLSFASKPNLTFSGKTLFAGKTIIRQL